MRLMIAVASLILISSGCGPVDGPLLDDSELAGAKADGRTFRPGRLTCRIPRESIVVQQTRPAADSPFASSEPGAADVSYEVTIDIKEPAFPPPPVAKDVEERPSLYYDLRDDWGMAQVTVSRDGGEEQIHDVLGLRFGVHEHLFFMVIVEDNGAYRSNRYFSFFLHGDDRITWLDHEHAQDYATGLAVPDVVHKTVQTASVQCSR